jgi:hypothetical protein
MPSFGIAKRKLPPCPIPRFTAQPRSRAALVELNDTKGTKVPGPFVAAAAHCQRQAVFAGEVHRGDHVGHVHAAGRLPVVVPQDHLRPL